MKACLLALVFSFGLAPSAVQAAHPLITDDAGTQGRGKYQLEFIGEYDRSKDAGTTTIVFPTIPVLTYGVADPLDAAVGVSSVRTRTEGPEKTTDARGVSDTSLQIKWRFYEQDGLCFAVKPGLTLATGDENKGLGAGRTTYSLFFISTQQLKSGAVHLNAGYRKNGNVADQREDIWHASLAAEAEAAHGIRGVINAGAETNPERNSGRFQEFLLGGVVCSVTQNADLDFGLKKRAFHEAHADYSLLGGLTLRF